MRTREEIVRRFKKLFMARECSGLLEYISRNGRWGLTNPSVWKEENYMSLGTFSFNRETLKRVKGVLLLWKDKGVWLSDIDTALRFFRRKNRIEIGIYRLKYNVSICFRGDCTVLLAPLVTYSTVYCTDVRRVFLTEEDVRKYKTLQFLWRLEG